MKLLGDEAEAEVAGRLAGMGFELVYQSRGSRGAFDLLATRGSAQLGVQVKRSPLPLRFSRDTWGRMEADARRFDWRWLVAAVDPKDGRVRFIDAGAARVGAEIRLGPEAEIDGVLPWLATGLASP